MKLFAIIAFAYAAVSEPTPAEVVQSQTERPSEVVPSQDYFPTHDYEPLFVCDHIVRRHLYRMINQMCRDLEHANLN